MEVKVSKHASKRVHACARARVRVRVRVCACARPNGRAARGGSPAEDESELRSHACVVAKVETRGRVPGVGRIVVVTPCIDTYALTPQCGRRLRQHREGSEGEG
jgi:hypothetical protein